jgi:hypothetical protein
LSGDRTSHSASVRRSRLSPSTDHRRIARRNARLVRIEASFDGAFELPKFGLDEMGMQQPANATKLRAGVPANASRDSWLVSLLE